MTELERRKKLQEEEERKRRQTKKEDYSSVITEDGTLASFNFSDNYKTKSEK